MEWLDRALIVSPLCYGLCLDEKDFKRALKKLKIDEEVGFLLNENADATVHLFTKDGMTASIVCLGNVRGKTIEQLHSLLLHEAVHIWQVIKEQLNEREPSIEFEAYSIQTIAQNLFCSYKDQKKKRAR